jgi:hypothetical protein
MVVAFACGHRTGSHAVSKPSRSWTVKHNHQQAARCSRARDYEPALANRIINKPARLFTGDNLVDVARGNAVSSNVLDIVLIPKDHDAHPLIVSRSYDSS